MLNPRNPSMYDFDREIAKRAEQISKLPVWAKDLLGHLHRDLTETRKFLVEIIQSPEGNTTIVDPSGSFPRPIGINPTVEHDFTGLPGHRVQVDFFSDHVVIHENGGRGGLLAIHPKSANAVEIHSLSRRI